MATTQQEQCCQDESGEEGVVHHRTLLGLLYVPLGTPMQYLSVVEQEERERTSVKL